MNDLIAPDMAIGGLALAVVIIYAAWREYTTKNQRDAKLLASVGAASLLGSAAAWLN